jgi:hypothetical protein
MIVLDCSAAVEIVLETETGRSLRSLMLGEEQVISSSLLYAETTMVPDDDDSALRPAFAQWRVLGYDRIFLKSTQHRQGWCRRDDADRSMQTE